MNGWGEVGGERACSVFGQVHRRVSFRALVPPNLRLFSLVGLALAAWLAARWSPAAERLNVLVIAVDDLRPQLGCYGDPVAQTPNIDRLAERGLVFDRAYCQEGLCSPSRISLLSGRRPSTSKIYWIGPTLRSAMPDITTLPQHFKNHGYSARSVGKIYHPGIDDPASWSVPSWESQKPRVGPEGLKRIEEWKHLSAARKKELTGPERGFFPEPAFEAADVGDDDLSDGDTAREGIAALRELAATPAQPFFLAVGFIHTHVPWVAPRHYWDLYDEANLPLPDNQFLPRNAPAFAAETGDDFYWYSNVPKDRKLSEPFKRQCLHGYLATISYVDALVGRLLEELDRLELRDRTVVLFFGDNGFYMGEHGWWGGKHNNYEGATRVPLIVSAPHMQSAGQQTRALVELVDIYPSLVELCGLPPAADLEGTSFVPLLHDPGRAWKKAAFSEYDLGGCIGLAMRTDRYRYVAWQPKKGGDVRAIELYDHQTDPQENVNIAPEADQALLDQLADQLRGYWQAARPE